MKEFGEINQGFIRLDDMRDLERVFELIQAQAQDKIGVRGLLMLGVDVRKKLIYNYINFVDDRIEINYENNYLQDTVNSGEPLICNSDGSRELINLFAPHFDFSIDNMMILPLYGSKDKPIAFIAFFNKRNGNFSNKDLVFGGNLAGQIGAVFENVYLLKELQHTFQSLVEVMAIAIDKKHPISSGHSRRVARLSATIARKMGLDEQTVSNIRLAGFLHDYGKISIPDSILKKADPLSDEEYRIMKGHAESTLSILSRVYFMNEQRNIPEIASSHHERYDGKGYPLGLKGDEIPLGGRVIAVADVFDAMTSWREYHNPRSRIDARNEIEKGKGTIFDPNVVKAFLYLFDNDKLPSNDVKGQSNTTKFNDVVD
jgi:HD-GYP domain-containing protein (c-di-GMP phosphodiesterase class II)